MVPVEAMTLGFYPDPRTWALGEEVAEGAVLTREAQSVSLRSRCSQLPEVSSCYPEAFSPSSQGWGRGSVVKYLLCVCEDLTLDSQSPGKAGYSDVTVISAPQRDRGGGGGNRSLGSSWTSV